MFLPSKWRHLLVMVLGFMVSVSLPLSADETEKAAVEEAPKFLEEVVAEFDKSTGLRGAAW